MHGNFDFRYVPTKENPADIGTRGFSAEEFKSSIWFQGPVWLFQMKLHGVYGITTFFLIRQKF